MVNEHLFPSRADSYMISCYFILLMNIHKKQNGQLAEPFIPGVWLFLFGECHSLGSGLVPQSAAGQPLRSPLLAPSPVPLPYCFASSCVLSASLLPSQPDTSSLLQSQAPPPLTSKRTPHFLHFSSNQTTSLSHPRFNIRLNPPSFQKSTPIDMGEAS